MNVEQNMNYEHTLLLFMIFGCDNFMHILIPDENVQTLYFDIH